MYASAAPAPFPAPLASLVSSLAAAVGSSTRAEAAIVNYYAMDSTLGGHLDDAEYYMGSPIVSIRYWSLIALARSSRSQPRMQLHLFDRRQDEGGSPRRHPPP